MGAWIMAPFSVEDLREGRDGLRFLNRAKKAPVLATALRTTRANPLASLCLVSASGGNSLGIWFVAAES